jgi:NAD-dependent deacetylase
MSIEKLREIIEASDNIVFFGGAGVSTESNIPDFRSSKGIYSIYDNLEYPPEEILSYSFFRKHPDYFYDFYRNNLIYKDAKPNDAHIALAELEKRGKLKAIITQNIDGLHQKAGSKNVLELHGSIYRNYCMKCYKEFDLDYILNSEGVPLCDKCKGIVRPDVVMYEEALDMHVLRKSIEYIQNAEVLIVGGTSLVVYPAAGLIDYYTGDKLILINKSQTPYDSRATLVFNDSIGKVLKQAVF